MAKHEWVHLTNEQLEADEALSGAIDRFEAPPTPAGEAATEWLKRSALHRSSHVATYVLVEDDHVLAFYSLGMGEVELRTQHRKKLGSRHPRVGGAVVLWLARAADAEVGAETILRHAVGIAQIAGRRVGAGVIALDPFDSATESSGGSDSASGPR